MAHFEAYLHVMTVGTSNKCAVNMNIMTRTLQTEANGKFGKEKVKTSPETGQTHGHDPS